LVVPEVPSVLPATNEDVTTSPVKEIFLTLLPENSVIRAKLPSAEMSTHLGRSKAMLVPEPSAYELDGFPAMLVTMRLIRSILRMAPADSQASAYVPSGEMDIPIIPLNVAAVPIPSKEPLVDPPTITVEVNDTRLIFRILVLCPINPNPPVGDSTIIPPKPVTPCKVETEVDPMSNFLIVLPPSQSPINIYTGYEVLHTLDDPAGLFNPVAQGVQVEALPKPYVPTGQGSHVVEYPSTMYDPAPQPQQSAELDEPAGLVKPAAHATLAVPPVQ
jgi:hypothetical protein